MEEDGNSIMSREKLDQVATWVDSTVTSAFFSFLERFSCVLLVLALAWEKELGLVALVEKEQQVGALVSVRQLKPRLHHLSLCRYHLLCSSLGFHGGSLFHNYDDLPN